MEPRIEFVEDQATRAYFRRFGSKAPTPNRKLSKLFEKEGKHYIRLANEERALATYRIAHRSGGGWRLTFVEEK